MRLFGRRERLLLPRSGKENSIRRTSTGCHAAWYAERLPSVEIINTFYRMPKATCSRTGRLRRRKLPVSRSSFAPHHHMARLKAEAAADSVGFSTGTLRRSAPSAARCFPLPPFNEEDLPRPERNFSTCCPRDMAPRSSLRNESWLCDDVYDALRAAGAALSSGARRHAPPPLVENGSMGLRPASARDLSDGDLQHGRIGCRHGGREIYVFSCTRPTAPGAQTLMRWA